MSRNGFVWSLYRGATAVLEIGAPLFLRWRLRHGKEDPDRLGERLGRAAIARPEGRLVWLHGASVGEGLALLPLVERLVTRGDAVLVTTGTVGSSRVVAARLPRGAIHQFIPLDGPAAVARFLDHWRPDLAVFAESELWPNLLGEARRRGVPTALVNARMSARSFGRWRRLPRVVAGLLGTLDVILAQTEADADRYAALSGRPVGNAGNLKFDAMPPPADEAALAGLRRGLAGRPVWVAASTHAGEDELCCDVHGQLAPALPGLLTIIVPRRVARGPDIEAYAARLGLRVALRSRSEAMSAATDVYVADTMGELGLFYRLGTPVFMGKSLDPEGGGQNPIEPAKLGNAVLHGPRTANFADVYAAFDAAGAAVPVADAAALAAAVGALLADASALSRRIARAREVAAHHAGAVDTILRHLDTLLPPRARP